MLALIAAGSFIAAMLAGADNVTVRQKAAVIDRVDLPGNSFFKEAVLIQLMVEVLGDLVVLRRV